MTYTREEIINRLNDFVMGWEKPKSVTADFWKAVIQALSQEPCDDAISRQSAIFLANDLKQDLPDDESIADMVMTHNEGILEYQTQLSLLPSVTQKSESVTEFAIPMSDIDGIKAEIKTEISDYEGYADFYEGIRFGLRTALEIIDKHSNGRK